MLSCYACGKPVDPETHRRQLAEQEALDVEETEGYVDATSTAHCLPLEDGEGFDEDDNAVLCTDCHGAGMRAARGA